MIKLEDLITASYSSITIMDGSFEIVNIDSHRFHKTYFSKELLDREIERMESRNGYIRVWLKENKE